MTNFAASISISLVPKSLMRGARQISGGLRGVQKSVRDLGGAAKYLEKDFQKLRNRLTSGGQLTLVTDALNRSARQMQRVISGPIQTAARFEEQIAKVGAVSRATEEDQLKLSDAAREWGATTPFSAIQVAQGMEYLAMAGFPVQKILEALPGLLDLSTASATDLARTSDIASDILSGFGLSASEMPRVADILTATTTSANVSLDQLGETMKYVGPIAKAAGLEIEEAAAMAGLLGNVGIKGSMAGTVLRSMIQKLAAPTSAASDLLAELGLKTKDAEGNLRAIPDILFDIAGKLKGMGSAKRIEILKVLVGEEAATGVSELIDQEGASRAISIYAEELRRSQGEASRTANKMNETTMGSFKALSSAVESLSISFGSLLLPAATSVAIGLRNLTGWVDNFTQKFPALTRWVGYAIAVLAGLFLAIAVVGMALAGILGTMAAVYIGLKWLAIRSLLAVFATGKLAVSVWRVGRAMFVAAARGVWVFGKSLILLALGGIKKVITGLRALAVALVSNPVFAAAALLALAAGLVVMHWDRVKEFFLTIWEKIKPVWEAFAGWVGEWLEKITAPFKWLFSAIDKVQKKIGGIGGASKNRSRKGVLASEQGEEESEKTSKTYRSVNSVPEDLIPNFFGLRSEDEEDDGKRGKPIIIRGVTVGYDPVLPKLPEVEDFTQVPMPKPAYLKKGDDDWAEPEQPESADALMESLERTRPGAAEQVHQNIDGRREYNTNYYITIWATPNQDARDIADEIQRRQEQARLAAHHDGDEL